MNPFILIPFPSCSRSLENQKQNKMLMIRFISVYSDRTYIYVFQFLLIAYQRHNHGYNMTCIIVTFDKLWNNNKNKRQTEGTEEASDKRRKIEELGT
jgi:hypothetical protein